MGQNVYGVLLKIIIKKKRIVEKSRQICVEKKIFETTFVLYTFRPYSCANVIHFFINSLYSFPYLVINERKKKTIEMNGILAKDVP